MPTRTTPPPIRRLDAWHERHFETSRSRVYKVALGLTGLWASRVTKIHNIHDVFKIVRVTPRALPNPLLQTLQVVRMEIRRAAYCVLSTRFIMY